MKQSIVTTRTAMAILLFLLSASLSEAGMASLFTKDIQNIEMSAEAEGELKEETKIHTLQSIQPISPKKRLSRTVKTIYPLLALPKHHPLPQSTVLRNTRVIAYCSFLL